MLFAPPFGHMAANQVGGKDCCVHRSRSIIAGFPDLSMVFGDFCEGTER
jgi:hypothetical protein